MGTPRVEVDQQMRIDSVNRVEAGVFRLNDEEKEEVVDPNAQDTVILAREPSGRWCSSEGRYRQNRRP